jgi:hypothetical protein
MEGSNRPRLQEQEVVAALESLRALDSLVDALAAKVDDFDRRIAVVESRLEENIPGQD